VAKNRTDSRTSKSKPSLAGAYSEPPSAQPLSPPPPPPSSTGPNSDGVNLAGVDSLVTGNLGWAESIARSVARSWNLDWQQDGLDGAAFEAILFCARRYDASRGVPFRAYARRRIHEAATEAARKTKAWARGESGSGTPVTKQEQEARELSSQLLNLYPELREGEMPAGAGEAGGDARAAIRSLLMSASLLAAGSSGEDGFAEEALDAKRMVQAMVPLDVVHQEIMWKLYWEGVSMRGLANEWSIDELNIVREHKALLQFLQKVFSTPAGRGGGGEPPKVRPGLKDVSASLKRKKTSPPFTRIVEAIGT